MQNDIKTRASGRIINISGKDEAEMIEKARGYDKIQIKIRSRTERIVFSFVESASGVVLSGFQKVAKTWKRVCEILDDKIEDKIGDESDIPDFAEVYPIETIIAMALSCPESIKTIMATKEHFNISKRQAIRIRREIDDGFPSFPVRSKLMEIIAESWHISDKFPA